MALNIRNEEAERLAVEVASMTGETKTEAVIKALNQRLILLKKRRMKRRLADRLDKIARHCAALPVRDSRKPEDLLYNEHGLPS